MTNEITNQQEVKILTDKELDYVCHDHQTLASKCGCLQLDDYCRQCGSRKVASVDGKHCRLCDW